MKPNPQASLKIKDAGAGGTPEGGAIMVKHRVRHGYIRDFSGLKTLDSVNVLKDASHRFRVIPTPVPSRIAH